MKLLNAILILALPAAAQTVKLPGELQPYQRVGLTARVTGIVEEVRVDRGSAVKAGEPLVVLSAPEMKAQIAEAEAKAQAVEAQRAEAEAKRVSAESAFERMKSAAKTPGAVAAHDLIQTEKMLEAAGALVGALARSGEAARAQASALKEMESYLRIAAPFDGVITARHAHPGALASPSSGALLEIEQVERLRLVVPVPESEVGSIPRGRRLSFTVPAHPGRTFQGVVTRVSRSLDTATRTMPVELEVANPAGALAPGMYCEVAWPVKAK